MSSSCDKHTSFRVTRTNHGKVLVVNASSALRSSSQSWLFGVASEWSGCVAMSVSIGTVVSSNERRQDRVSPCALRRPFLYRTSESNLLIRIRKTKVGCLPLRFSGTIVTTLDQSRRKKMFLECYGRRFESPTKRVSSFYATE